MFSDADANGDGTLDATEWAVFHQKSNEMKVAEGNYVDDRPDRCQTKYTTLNLINPAQEGVTMDDIRQSMVHAHPIWEELRIADGLWVACSSKEEGYLSKHFLLDLLDLSKSTVPWCASTATFT